MILFLGIGIAIGAVAVIFAMENTAPVTVTFLSWQFTAPLSIVILEALVIGMTIAVCMMLPRAVREAFDRYAVRRAERAEKKPAETAYADSGQIAL